MESDGITFRGEWTSGELFYRECDVVSWGGRMWIAVETGYYFQEPGTAAGSKVWFELAAGRQS